MKLELVTRLNKFILEIKFVDYKENSVIIIKSNLLYLVITINERNYPVIDKVDIIS
jgi:hypothetical protein